MVNKTKVNKVKIETIVVQVFSCTRCGYRWVPKFEFNHFSPSSTDGTARRPVACAHCHSPYYDKQHKGNNNGKE